MAHTIQWQTASPLWKEALKDTHSRKRFHRPSILRFAGDDFMESLQQVLDEAPEQLKDFVARFETWRNETAGWLLESQLPEPDPLKLYQPVHNRFYLVAASLCCRLPGLPDRLVDTAAEERASFILRRLAAQPGKIVDPEDRSTYFEYGWSPSLGWSQAADPEAVDVAEERLPMFGMVFGENGRQRRLLVGLLPAASGETFRAAPALSPFLRDDGSLPSDPRLEAFISTVAAGMVSLYQELTNPSVNITPAQAQEIFIFSLLDFAEFVHTYLEGSWTAIATLDDSVFYGSMRWHTALQKVWEKQAEIMSGETKTLHCIDISLPSNEALIPDLIIDAIDDVIVKEGPPVNRGLVNCSAGICTYDEEFNTLILAALQSVSRTEAQSVPVEAPKLDPAGGDFYVVRCVFERPGCVVLPPGLRSAQPTPLYSPVVGDRSQAFRLAPFFDPDAPSRQMRITMPIDTSPEGLRKFPKNVSVLISDQLARQMARLDGIKMSALEDGNLNADPGLDLGMICSLSIPIITICAMILLMIIVSLLNIVFWWLPLFKICFPLNLKVR